MGVKGGHRRRWRLAVGTLCTVVVVTLAGVAASSGDGSSTPGRSPAEVAEMSAFYRDARLSLSPLLTHLTQQSQLFKELLAGRAPTTATGDLVRAWAGDYATARDLVGRLPAPASARPARDLYRLGAMLYVESARTLAAAPGSADPAQEVRAARRVQLLGDAAFDAGHRLVLPQTESGAIAVQRPVAPPVPDFAAEGVAPPAADVPARPARWPAVLDQIATLARQASAWMAGGPPVPGGNAIAAGVLWAAADALTGDKQGTGSGQDPTDVLRLAALAEAEALRGSAVSESGRRLQAIAAGLWTVGRDLAPGRAGGAAPEWVVPAPDAALLDAGGLFNGHPPVLRPGDPPDKDVPGGLPSLNGVLSGGSG